MNKKVSLKEIVGTQIVLSLILASYYWMWARSDWKDWYEIFQVVIGVVFFAFFMFQALRIKKYKKEGVDEMAEQNLRRCDSICLKLFVGVMTFTAWACAIMGHVGKVNQSVIGWIIIISIVSLTIVRTVLFVIMDRKGI